MERVLADVHVMFRALLPVGGSFDSAELGRDSLRLRLFLFFLFLDLLSKNVLAAGPAVLYSSSRR